MLPLDLILGDDDLARVDVTSVGYWMTQDADDTDHLANFGGAIHGVAGVADQLLAPGDLRWGEQPKGQGSLERFDSQRKGERRAKPTAEQTAYLSLGLDSNHLPVLHHDLVDGLVQHVRPTVNGAQPAMGEKGVRCCFIRHRSYSIIHKGNIKNMSTQFS